VVSKSATKALAVPRRWGKTSFPGSGLARRRRRRLTTDHATEVVLAHPGIPYTCATRRSQSSITRGRRRDRSSLAGGAAARRRFCAKCARPEKERREAKSSVDGRILPMRRVSPLACSPRAPAPPTPASPTSRAGFPRATSLGRQSRSSAAAYRNLDPRSFPLRRAALPAGPSRHSLSRKSFRARRASAHAQGQSVLASPERGRQRSAIGRQAASARWGPVAEGQFRPCFPHISRTITCSRCSSAPAGKQFDLHSALCHRTAPWTVRNCGRHGYAGRWRGFRVAHDLSEPFARSVLSVKSVILHLHPRAHSHAPARKGPCARPPLLIGAAVSFSACRVRVDFH
jgi:hypothetical protein